MLKVSSILILFFIVCSCSINQCLRGKISKSKDDFSYLVIVDNNGGLCGELYVDGKKWLSDINQKTKIELGTHYISCGDSLKENSVEFKIPSKSIFYFDYWGP